MDDIEIIDAYDLFVESWEERLTISDYPQNLNWSQTERCNYWADPVNPFGGLESDVPLNRLVTDPQGYTYLEFSDAANEVVSRNGFDPLRLKGAWVTVMAYMLTHYHYLYE